MLKRLTRRQRGFTLIELLIVVAIIGIIAALLVPNFIDALQKAKQKRTVGDMRDWGVAAMSWFTDQVGAASAGQGTTVDLSDFSGGSWDYGLIRDQLVPNYIQEMPLADGWKTEYSYGLNIDNPLALRVTIVGSPGRDRTWGDPVTGTVGDALTGTFTVGAFDPTDYQQDIVWSDGFFLRWPEKTTAVGGGTP